MQCLWTFPFLENSYTLICVVIYIGYNSQYWTAQLEHLPSNAVSALFKLCYSL